MNDFSRVPKCILYRRWGLQCLWIVTTFVCYDKAVSKRNLLVRKRLAFIVLPGVGLSGSSRICWFLKLPVGLEKDAFLGHKDILGLSNRRRIRRAQKKAALLAEVDADCDDFRRQAPGRIAGHHQPAGLYLTSGQFLFNLRAPPQKREPYTAPQRGK